MKTINVNARSKALNKLLKIAQRNNVLLKTSDGEQFILTRATDWRSFSVNYQGDNFDKEIEAARRNKKLMKFLEKRGKKAKAKKGIPLREVKQQAGLDR
jgi:hypothetical protein